MANETKVTVVGNLTADPELRYSEKGIPWVKFTVASTPRVFNPGSGQWEDGEPLYLPCVVWRDAAENIAESLVKGCRVVVHGDLVQRSWQTDEGQKRSRLEMKNPEVAASLLYARAEVTKVPRNQQRQAPQQPQQQGWQQGGFNAQGF